MRRAFAVLAIGWYFGFSGGTIGPFDNEQICNEFRGRFLAPTKCWYYGGGGQR